MGSSSSTDTAAVNLEIERLRNTALRPEAVPTPRLASDQQLQRLLASASVLQRALPSLPEPAPQASSSHTGDAHTDAMQAQAQQISTQIQAAHRRFERMSAQMPQPPASESKPKKPA